MLSIDNSFNNLYNNNKDLNICHIFVHFFEIGGGTSLHKNFTLYNEPDNIKLNDFLDSKLKFGANDKGLYTGKAGEKIGRAHV